MTSPVSVPDAGPAAGQTWLATPDGLFVSWGVNRATLYRSSEPERPSGSPAPPPDPMDGRNRRGYAVTTAMITRSDTGTALSVTTAPTSVNGHPAVLSTANIAPSVSFGVHATRWLSWKLADGRLLSVWNADAPSEAALVQFAGGFTERPTSLTRPLAVVFSLPGMTERKSYYAGDLTPYSLYPAGETLCPAGTAVPMEDLLTPDCLVITVMHGSNAARLGMNITEHPRTITSGTVTVTAFPAHHLAYDVVSSLDAVFLQSPQKVPVTAKDLALLISSTRVDPVLISN